MPTPASKRYLQQPVGTMRAARPYRRAKAAQERPLRAAQIGFQGLALIGMVYLLYVPVGPPLIYNDLVYGPSHLSETLALIWSGGRYLAALAVAPGLLIATGGRPLARCWPLLPFAIFAAASIAWSAVPKESIRSALNLFALIITASALVNWYGLAGFGRGLQIGAGLIMIASLLTALLLPRLGVHHAYDLVASIHAGRWRGIFQHKNLLGAFAVTSLIYSLRSTRYETRPWKILFSVARLCTVVCLIMAGSAGALGGGLIAMAFFMMMKNRVTANPLAIGAMIFVGIALFYGLSLNGGHIAKALGRDSTFTGRTEIWTLGWSMIQRHLLFGYGLSTDGTFMSSSSFAVDLESGYLALVFDLGLVGAALMLVGVGAAMLRGYAHIQTSSGEERDQAVIFMTVVVAAWTMATAETSTVGLMGDGAIGLWTALPALYQLGFTARRQNRAARGLRKVG